MPIFKNRVTVGIGRKTRLFLNVEAGATGFGDIGRRIVAQLRARKSAKSMTALAAKALPRQMGRGVSALRNGSGADSIEPQQIIWIFGTGRSGSTWLGNILGDYQGNALWHEPYVGEVFGTAYYVRAWNRQRERDGYILSDAYKDVWLNSMRNLVLDGANARYPGLKGQLIIKEPHGSIAAPLLMEAFPESRLIFLVRDPRDVVSSRLDAHRKDSWTAKLTGNNEETLADRDPDAFVEKAARLYLDHMEKAKQASDAFRGHKTIIKYEELRSNTFSELKRACSELEIPVEEDVLRGVIEKHAWENIPEERKGAGKSHRKATPGGWKDDLTSKQVETVERITAPLFEEFYAD